MTKYDPVARCETVRELKRSGKSYAEIGEIMGISRQRVQQLIRLPHEERIKMIESANGVCQHCGKPSRKLDAHHEDYSTAPSLILCTACHRKADGLQNQRNNETSKRIKWGYKSMAHNKRLNQHYTVSSITNESLHEMHKKLRIPMSRLIDESVALFHSVVNAPGSVQCRLTPTGIEISEVPQEAI